MVNQLLDELLEQTLLSFYKNFSLPKVVRADDFVVN